jgi:hypothetical protein
MSGKHAKIKSPLNNFLVLQSSTDYLEVAIFCSFKLHIVMTPIDLDRSADKTPESILIKSVIKSVIKSAETCNDFPPFQPLPKRSPEYSKTRTGRVLGLMELTGVEPVSKLDINTSFIHRFSFSNPRSGNPTLSRR